MYRTFWPQVWSKHWYSAFQFRAGQWFMPHL